MPLSWNEIKSRALSFSRSWADVSSEDAEAKTFWNEFFHIFGISRRRVASFEERVKKIDGRDGYIDLLWKGMLLIEHKSKGKDLDTSVSEWEMRVTYIERAKTRDIGYSEEYDYDLWSRSELYREMQHAQEEELRKFRDRIAQADQRFKNVTVEKCTPNNHMDNPDKEIHWWLFRVNKE